MKHFPISNKFAHPDFTGCARYGCALSVAFIIAAPLKAQAGAWCDVKPESQAILDSSGGVIGQISGPQRVEIEQKISQGHYEPATYKIDLQGGYFYTVHQGTSKNRRFPAACKSDSRFSWSERGELAWDSLVFSI